MWVMAIFKFKCFKMFKNSGFMFLQTWCCSFLVSSLTIFMLIFFLRFTYLKGRFYRAKERQREVLAHTPKGHIGWNWTDTKLGARSLYLVSHVGAGAQWLGPSSSYAAFPDHEQRAAKTQTSTHIRCQCHRAEIACCTTMLPLYSLYTTF